MPSISKTGHRFRETFVTEAGIPFLGTLFPADEGDVPSYDFSTPRLFLRVGPDCPARTRSILVDQHDRYFLLADHDLTNHYRTHRLFQLTHEVPWSRVTTVKDALTGLARRTGESNLGPLRCLIEMYGRETPDPGMKVKEEVRRVITGAEIQLGDKIDGMIVKRLDPVLGVFLAEIQ